MSENTEKTTQKKKHIALKIIVGVIAILILLVSTLLICALETAPGRRVSGVPNQQDQIAIAMMMGKFFSSLQEAHGNRAETCTITFTEMELNAFFTTALRALEQHQKPSDPIIFVEWKNGMMYADFSLKAMGCYANIRSVVIPEVSNNKIKVNVQSCKLGCLTLPANKLEAAIDQEITRHSDDPKVQAVLKAIKGIKVTEDGSVEIVINIKAAPELVVLLS